jgi:hypothetical protein
MIGGMFGSYNVALAWISSTFARPRAKRAAAYATINSLGNSQSSLIKTLVSADDQSPRSGPHTCTIRNTVPDIQQVPLSQGTL